MARDNGAIIVRGPVLSVEHKAGTTVKGQAYAFDVVTILTGKAVSEVRWPDTLGAPPREDEFVALEVGLDIFNGRQQIEGQRRVDPALSAVKQAG